MNNGEKERKKERDIYIYIVFRWFLQFRVFTEARACRLLLLLLPLPLSTLLRICIYARARERRVINAAIQVNRARSRPTARSAVRAKRDGADAAICEGNKSYARRAASAKI